jgi:hypothetical protein
MTIVVDSKRFTITEMEAGTVPDAWMATMTITTWRGIAQSIVGSNTVLLTVIYE